MGNRCNHLQPCNPCNLFTGGLIQQQGRLKRLKGYNMIENDNDNNGLIIDEQGQLIKAPPRNRSIVLKTALDVRRELARVYNDARFGRIEASDATKLGYLLNTIRTAIETSDLEQRLEALEQQGTQP